ncbi:hypothetical protein CERSUDRAFT_97310 [Gelatoporia subvermispora B]|uniref:RNA helicase n=1 Tax=Ceriporiopsis subvermispora (strain B) TaxID=914234 RepID=M2PFL1_CERS8|nr:hypothetical protein CERSUDRAFT_97310 [Gelatoporia subvermispora B]
MVAYYKALYEQAELDKHSVVVSHAAGVDLGIIDIADAQQGVSAILTILVSNSTSRVVIRAVEAFTTSSRTVSPLIANIPLGSALTILTYGQPFFLPIVFRHNNIGDYQGYVGITFEDAINRQFVIIRQLKVVVGDPADYELLQPRIPYRKRLRVQGREDLAAEPGIVPKLMTLPWVRRLPEAPVPKALKMLLKKRPEDDTLETLRTTWMPQALIQQSHKKFFERLLWMEETEIERRLRAYDMADVRFKAERVYYTLIVPGLAEKRPSVIEGDRINAQRVGVNDDRTFEGCVHIVRQDDHDSLNGQASGTVLFPETSDTSPHIVDGTIDPSTLLNPLVADNPEQVRAINNIAQLHPDCAPYIVFGPPGTGKTSTIVEAILQVLDRHKDARILACAPSNSAADEILRRLSPRLNKSLMFRFNAVSRQHVTIPKDLLQYCYALQGIFAIPSTERLHKTRAMVSTCVSAAFAYGIGLEPGYFTHIFVDEAAQATEPEVMVAVKRMTTASTRVVLSGDPKQLGPIIVSNFARELGLGKSYLERLMERPVYTDLSVRQRTITKLLRNYRSHEAILTFPNARFYDNELQRCGSPSVINSYVGSPILANPRFPVVFHAITSIDNREASSPSYFNIGQVTLVKDYVTKLLQRGTNIGIVTPYYAQTKKIRKALERITCETTVGTVEAFQGTERRVIIISTVRSTRELLVHDIKHALGFVTNPRRFNVAVTRAQALLIVIGDPSVLSLDPLWRGFMNYVFINGGWKGDAPAWDTSAPVDDTGDYVQEVLEAAMQDINEFARKMEGLSLEDDGEDGGAGDDRPWREVE